jgi:hypothetical protein
VGQASCQNVEVGAGKPLQPPDWQVVHGESDAGSKVTFSSWNVPVNGPLMGALVARAQGSAGSYPGVTYGVQGA